ncbi:Hsp70 family protein [Williamsia sp. CHRR-6]|uniref:Hsp70 family protein n=1 Tax=Williamsia sp. CHRR-6 TaxID=2835871 RepID=UPI001BDAD4D4|nr:Hsp70 family protein [Williamsia sp. CHRR-6]MBT0566245.1 Hsp70 family protein [Williamsia sp. CHRR-6]
MAAGLGLKIGAATSVAVSSTPSHTFDAVVRDTADVVAAQLATRSGSATSASTSLVGFTQRVGDPVGLIDAGGHSHQAAEVYARALTMLETELGGDAVVVAVPNTWQPYAIDALRAAANKAGLVDITIVPEAIATIAAAYATRDDLIAATDSPAAGRDDIVVVYDLGATAVDISVVATGAESAIIGRPLHVEDISGAGFDQQILAHVLESVGAVDVIDPFDPTTVSALSQVRARCASAKENLSTDTETTVVVSLPGLRTETRLVRAELEDLLREQVTASVAMVSEAVAAAGHSMQDVTAVVAAGGGASVPLVSELLSATLRVPVIVDADPVTTSAFGAALLADEIAGAAAAVDTIPVTGVEGTQRPSTSRAIAPAPRSTLATATPAMGKAKRLTLIGGIAAGLAVLTAGGLSVGTALTEKSGPTTTTEPAAEPTASTPSTAPRTTAAPASTAAGQGAAASTSAPVATPAPAPAAASPRPGAASVPTSVRNTIPPRSSGTSPGSGDNGNSGGTDSGGGDSGGNVPTVPDAPAVPTLPRPTLPALPGLAEIPGQIGQGISGLLTGTGTGTGTGN